MSELQLLREQVTDRLRTQLALRKRLRREAAIEAVLGLCCGFALGVCMVLRQHYQPAAIVAAPLALAACMLSALDRRRLNEIEAQIRRAVAFLAEHGVGQ